MARWVPGPAAPIGQNERIGRRLCNEGWLEQYKAPTRMGLAPTNFEPEDGELSVDRLGQTGVDKRVAKLLWSEAERLFAQRNPPQEFQGWVYATASRLMPRRAIQPSPTASNPYHAHLVAPVTPGLRADLVALELKDLFERHGVLRDRTGDRPLPGPPASPRPGPQSRLRRLLARSAGRLFPFLR